MLGKNFKKALVYNRNNTKYKTGARPLLKQVILELVQIKLCTKYKNTSYMSNISQDFYFHFLVKTEN